MLLTNRIARRQKLSRTDKRRLLAVLAEVCFLQDPTVRKAVEIALKQGQFSKPSLQTWLGKGRDYITSLEAWLVGVGVIEPFDGSKRPRKTLIRSLEEFDQMTSNTPKPEQ